MQILGGIVIFGPTINKPDLVILVFRGECLLVSLETSFVPSVWIRNVYTRKAYTTPTHHIIIYQYRNVSTTNLH